MSPLNITQPLGIWSIKVYNGYYKVMSNIPKMGHLPTPESCRWENPVFFYLRFDDFPSHRLMTGGKFYQKITLLRVIPTMTFIHFLTGKS